MSKGNPFELYFQGFISNFGGELLTEANDQGAKTADYHFEKHGIIAELKTLMGDSSTKMDAMMKEAVREWGVDPRSIPVKRDANNLPYIEPEFIPEAIRKKWMGKLFQEIERIVGSANKQIAHTKERFELPSARGVLFVANESNLYHSNFRSYRDALGALVLKRTATGERRYSHIDAGVYFSKALPSRIEQMPFWAPFHVEEPGNPNTELQAFLLELRTQWYVYLEKTMGITVRQHDSD
jgi:hypothetical protein